MRRLTLFIIILFTLLNFLSAAQNERKLTLLVQPFSGSGDKSLSWISKGITDTVVSDLTRIRSINVVTDEDRRRALHEMELAMIGLTGDEGSRNAGLLTGADIIVTGNCTASKNSIRVTARILNSTTGKIIASIKLDGTVTEIFSLQDNIVSSLIEETRKSGIEGFTLPEISGEDKIRIASKTIPDVPAYELYSKALTLAESNTSEALVLCDKAIEARPDYYEAIILGAYIENLSGHPSIALARIERAKAILKRKGSASDITVAFIEMNRAPILFALRRYQEAFDTYQSAKSIFEKASMTESSNYASVLTGMGASKRGLGDNAAALRFSNQALAIIEKLGMIKSGTYGWALLNTGIIYSVTGDHNEAINIFIKASGVFSSAGLSKSQGSALTDAQTGFSYYNTGKFDESLKYFLSSVSTASKMKIDNDENYAWYNWYIALIYFEKKGDLKKAVPFMERSVKLFKDSGSQEYSRANDYLIMLKNNTGK
jgi:tetratricopeptide (TPR) repeat protein/TolB-like protein